MEGALVSTATGALNPVLMKLAAQLCNEYMISKEVHKEIESFSSELTAIHSFLLKMSEEDRES
uniref:Disease resistance N-terminal domain-containing protein n=1 Tax=Oryza glaberrima TaxID=4538 RepID=I1QKM5_ORYGL